MLACLHLTAPLTAGLGSSCHCWLAGSVFQLLLCVQQHLNLVLLGLSCCLMSALGPKR